MRERATDVLATILTLLVLALVLWGGDLEPAIAKPLVASVGISYCALLLVWMYLGGAASPLWSWLPPFFPWGIFAKTSFARWAIVLLLVVGASVGNVIALLESISR